MLFNNLYKFHNSQYRHYKKPIHKISICTTKSPQPPNKNDIIIIIVVCSLFLIYKKIL